MTKLEAAPEWLRVAKARIDERVRPLTRRMEILEEAEDEWRAPEILAFHYEELVRLAEEMPVVAREAAAIAEYLRETARKEQQAPLPRRGRR